MQAINLNRWLIFFALLGMVISGQLWLAHSGQFQLPCTGSGCDEVARSQFSRFLGIPVATYGFFYFAGLVLLGLSRLQNADQWRIYGTYLLGLSTLGLLGFAFFTYIQFGVMKLQSPCWWCLGAAVSNLIIWLLAILDRRVSSPLESTTGGELRRALALVLFMLIAGSALAGWQWKQNSRSYDVVNSGGGVENEQQQLDRLLREGQGWAKGNLNAPLVIVEFSDFQCPACKQAYSFIEEELIGKLGKKIKFTFRHYPLTRIHPMAWVAASAAEEAGSQGKFWEIYDLMFLNQDQLTPEGITVMAKKLNLNVDKVKEAMEKSNEGPLFQRIYQDYEDGGKLGVNSTPTFIVYFKDKKMIKRSPGVGALVELLNTDPDIQKYLGVKVSLPTPAAPAP
jgi:protein-disulfide isomerase/uncharacterized membrane protein